MDIDRVAPELREAVERLPSVNVSNGVIRRLVRVSAGFLRGATVDGVRIEDVRKGAVRYRLYAPENASGSAMVWMHGGGLVIGSPKQTDKLCAETAAELGMVIASVEYRLAPRHPFPAPLDDCHAVWTEVLHNAAQWGIDPARIAIGGQSAGGGLAAALCQRIADEAGQQPAAQWLIYPMLDDRTAARTELDHEEHFIWTNRNNRFGWSAYLGRDAGSDYVPEYAVPARRAVLTGLPPAWIGVGSIDLFHDEDATYARRLIAAGIDAELDVVPGAPHGFEGAAPTTPTVRDFLARGRKWLKGATSPQEKPTK